MELQGYSSVVECLPSVYEALGCVPSITRKSKIKSNFKDLSKPIQGFLDRQA
jgi:hypothetical protein